MERTANPELDRMMINHLVKLYKLKTKRTGIHLSTLVYCLTRSFFDHVTPIEPTDKEVMLFALGLGLQDILTPQQAEAPVFEQDGVTFSPDFYLPFNNKYVELKTTRTSLKKNKEKLPETWLEYIMGGCYMRKVTTYELSGLYMFGSYSPPFPELYSETLRFEPAEIALNWQRLMKRKKVYEQAIKDNIPPTIFTYCKDWECKYCRHRLECEALVAIANKEDADGRE